MASPSQREGDHELLLQLRREVREVRQALAASDHNFRDHLDARMWNAAHGHVGFYDAGSGLYKTSIAPPMVVFHQQGAVVVASGKHFPVVQPCKVWAVAVALTTTGSTTTTAKLRKHDGTEIASLSLASSDPYEATETVDYPLAAGDRLYRDTTAAGTGAADLVMAVWATAV